MYSNSDDFRSILRSDLVRLTRNVCRDRGFCCGYRHSQYAKTGRNTAEQFNLPLAEAGSSLGYSMKSATTSWTKKMLQSAWSRVGCDARLYDKDQVSGD